MNKLEQEELINITEDVADSLFFLLLESHNSDSPCCEELKRLYNTAMDNLSRITNEF